MKIKFTWTSSCCRMIPVLLLLTLVISGCAEFDQLMKPRVEGLYTAPGFDNQALVEGNFGEIHVNSNLSREKVNHNTLETMLVAAIRDKRRDLMVSRDGAYEVDANLLSNDVTRRSDNFDTHLYRWTKRTIKVNYEVTEAESGKQVWSGIITTYREDIASYEFDQNEKSRDKVIGAVIAALNKEDRYPYPSPPLFNEVVKMNFQGFVLNMPRDK